MTLNEAARRLDRNPNYVRGAADGVGVTLMAAGAALVMTEADFLRLERQLSGVPKVKVRRRSALATA